MQKAFINVKFTKIAYTKTSAPSVKCMTTLRKGSKLETSVNHALQFTILIYDEGGLVAQYSGKKYKWLNYCKVFKFAKKSNNLKIMQIIVDLIEEEDSEFLNCQAIGRLLAKRRVPLLAEFHCLSCPNFVAMRPSQ